MLASISTPQASNEPSAAGRPFGSIDYAKQQHAHAHDPGSARYTLGADFASALACAPGRDPAFSPPTPPGDACSHAFAEMESRFRSRSLSPLHAGVSDACPGNICQLSIWCLVSQMPSCKAIAAHGPLRLHECKNSGRMRPLVYDCFQDFWPICLAPPAPGTIWGC